MTARPSNRNFGPAPTDLQERTIKVMNFSPNVTKEMLFELFSQGGPVRNVVYKQQFAFIEFEDIESVSYCLALFDGIELFGKNLVMQPKLPNNETFNHLNILKLYEQTFASNPNNWWTRFGNTSKPCPKHICSYSVNLNNTFDQSQNSYNNDSRNEYHDNQKQNYNYDNRYKERNRDNWKSNDNLKNNRNERRDSNDRYKNDYRGSKSFNKRQNPNSPLSKKKFMKHSSF